MALSAWVGRERHEIGSPDFLKAFFSTVFVRLENEDWGHRFPALMNEFYSGRLPYRLAEDALHEVRSIRDGLKSLPPNMVVWDFEDRAKLPPWGANISPRIEDLSSYFVTSDGKDLLAVLTRAFERAVESRRDVEIR